jgi:hypothetical protein
LVPSFGKPLSPREIVQRLHPWLNDSEATEAQAEQIARTLAETQSEAVLREVAQRLGVPAHAIGPNSAEAIRRVLLDQLHSVE